MIESTCRSNELGPMEPCCTANAWHGDWGLVSKKHQDTSTSLHPLSFEEVIAALANSPKQRILRLLGPTVPKKPPLGLRHQRSEPLCVGNFSSVEPKIKLTEIRGKMSLTHVMEHSVDSPL